MAEQLYTMNATTYKALDAAKIDKGQAFLSNDVTSTFTGEGLSMNMDIVQFVDQIAGEVAEILVKEAANELGIYAGKHAAAIAKLPKDIMAQVAETYAAEMKNITVGEIVKEITNTSKDTNAAQDAENRINESTTEKVDEVKQNVNVVTQEINDKTKEHIEKIKTILTYINEGPDWISDQLNKQLNDAKQNLHKKLALRWEETDKQFYDNFAKTQGEAIGKARAKKFKEDLMNKTNKQLKKANATLSKTKVNAKTKIMNTALKIAAKTGLL